MPYIVNTITYPSHKVNDVAEVLLKAVVQYPPRDDLYDVVIQASVKATKKGIQTMVVIEPKDGKLQETMDHIGKTLVMLFPIEGVEYTSEVQLTAVEAAAGVGMTMPEG